MKSLTTEVVNRWCPSRKRIDNLSSVAVIEEGMVKVMLV